MPRWQVKFPQLEGLQAVLDTLKVQSSWPTEGEALAELLRVCQHVLGKGLQAEDFELQSAALVRTSNGKTVPAALITNGYRVSQASPENLLFVPLNQLSPPVLAGEHFLHLRYDGVRLLPSGKYLAVDKCGVVPLGVVFWRAPGKNKLKPGTASAPGRNLNLKLKAQAWPARLRESSSRITAPVLWLRTS